MASNLDYLNPAYLPLEDKVNAFLEAQKALSRAQVAVENAQLPHTRAGSDAPGAAELKQDVARRQHELAQLEQEVIGLLPTRNEWLKVNLGYGPSRVGAWHVPGPAGAGEQFELRIVH